jgi:hypothetical protein
MVLSAEPNLEMKSEKEEKMLDDSKNNLFKVC